MESVCAGPTQTVGRTACVVVCSVSHLKLRADDWFGTDHFSLVFDDSKGLILKIFIPFSRIFFTCVEAMVPWVWDRNESAVVVGCGVECVVVLCAAYYCVCGVVNHT